MDNDGRNKQVHMGREVSSGSKRNRRRQRQSTNNPRDEPNLISGSPPPPPPPSPPPTTTTSVDVATKKQQQILGAKSNASQHDEYYDHNLNNLNNITRHLNETKDLELRGEVMLSSGGERANNHRYHENNSPIGSANSTQSNASGGGGECGQAHFNCKPYGVCQAHNSFGGATTSSDQSTERMSQTSLLAATPTMTNERESQHQQAEPRVVKFDMAEVIDLNQINLDLDLDLEKQQYNVITIQQEQHEAAKKTNQTGQSNSLVRQLGRRVSLLPQALARQMTWRDGSNERAVAATTAAATTASCTDDLRRYSLPVPRSPPEDIDEMSPLHSTLTGQVADLVPTTVAGVGGTITTVTRSKRKTAPLPRLVAKNGQVNLFLDNIDRRQYMRDLFTTMIDIKWRYNLMAAAFGFVFSWLFFACIWYLVLYFHDDLEHENDPNWSPCIVNVYSFPAALLFSIETQSTLGFGSRIISVECPGAILIFCSQLIFGVVVECLIVGMVFAKLSRPTKRSQTIMYSKYATVCLREGKMCLTFRVGDVRSKSHIIGATLRASLVSSKITQEGEIIPFYHHKLKVIIDDCKESLLLIWPVTIVHIIDELSPFYRLNSDELINFKFEIITVLEGTVESTGQSIQVRSSYLPSEVKWGYRFEPIVSTHGYGKYAQTIIDYNKFNRIIEVPTPKCSPMEYYADQILFDNTNTNTNTNTNGPLVAGDTHCRAASGTSGSCFNQQVMA